jgi:hypothetical protein
MSDKEIFDSLVMLGLICNLKQMVHSKKLLKEGKKLFFSQCDSKKHLEKQINNSIYKLRSLKKKNIFVIALFTKNELNEKKTSVALISCQKNFPQYFYVFKNFGSNVDISVLKNDLITLLFALKRHMFMNFPLSKKYKQLLQILFNISNFSNISIEGIVCFKKNITFGYKQAMLRLQMLKRLTIKS